jgi:hypothetical protein
MCPVCPHVCSVFARAHGLSNPGLVKTGPSRRRRRSLAPLDQWSRPSTRLLERAISATELSRSVKPAGNRHSYGYIAGAGTPGRLVACRRCGTAARYFRVAVPTVAGARSGKSAGYFRLYALPVRLESPAWLRQHAPDINVPGKAGQGRPQPDRVPGDDGIAGTGNGRARTGAVCARDGPRPGAMGRGPEHRDLHMPPGRDLRRRRTRQQRRPARQADEQQGRGSVSSQARNAASRRTSTAANLQVSHLRTVFGTLHRFRTLTSW